MCPHASWGRTSLCASASFAAACFIPCTATRFCSNMDTIDESCWTNAGLPYPAAALEDGAALPAGSRMTGASGGNGMSTACVAANTAMAAPIQASATTESRLPFAELAHEPMSRIEALDYGTAVTAPRRPRLEKPYNFATTANAGRQCARRL